MTAWPATGIRAGLPALLILVGVVLTGCCRVPEALRGPPVVEGYVVHDGLHSSLVLPGLLPDHPLLADAPWIEVGFSDVGWTVDGDETKGHACRLGLWPDDGAVEFGLVEDLDAFLRDPALESVQRVGFSRAGWSALQKRLVWWVDLDQDAIAVIDGRHYLPARRGFSAYNSCNDFVADLLKRGGHRICPRPWRTVGTLEAQLEAAGAETVPLAP